MSDSNFSAIRARLKYGSIEEFIDGYARFVSAGGMFIPMAATKLKPEGTTVRFQFLLADGTTAMLGEGTVIQVRTPDPGNARAPVGMLIKFSKLSQESKNLVDQLVAMKEFGGLSEASSSEAPAPEASEADVSAASEPEVSEPEISEPEISEPEQADDQLDDPTYEQRLDELLATDQQDRDAQEDVAASDEVAPEPSYGPRKLAQTEGGLQILAFDDMSDEQVGALDFEFGADEDDVEDMFAGLFGGGGSDGDSDSEAVFGDMFGLQVNEPAEVEPEEEIEYGSDEAFDDEEDDLADADLADDDVEEDEVEEDAYEDDDAEDDEVEEDAYEDDDVEDDEVEEDAYEDDDVEDDEVEEDAYEDDDVEEDEVEEDAYEDDDVEEDGEVEEDAYEDDDVEPDDEDDAYEESEVESDDDVEPDDEDDELEEEDAYEDDEVAEDEDEDDDAREVAAAAEDEVADEEDEDASLDEPLSEEALELDSLELLEDSDAEFLVEESAPSMPALPPDASGEIGVALSESSAVENSHDEPESRELDDLLETLDSTEEERSLELHLANDPIAAMEASEASDADEDEEDSLDFLLAAASADIAAMNAAEPAEDAAPNFDILDDVLGDTTMPPLPADEPMLSVPEKKKGFFSKLFGKD